MPFAAVDLLAVWSDGGLDSLCPTIVVAWDRDARRAALRAGASACVERDALSEVGLARAIEDAFDRFAALAGHPPVEGGLAMGSSQRESLSHLWARIEARMGFRPSFFTVGGQVQPVVGALYEFTERAFLDNPLPTSVKEQLFIYLSRLCPVPYCLARHCAFLLERERATGGKLDLAKVFDLLEEPLPDADMLETSLAALEQAEPVGANWPAWDSAVGYQLRIGCAQLLLHSYRATRWLYALRRLLGRSAVEQLLLFICFVRTAHFWTEIHPEIEFEPDLRELLREHQDLADALASVTAAAVRISHIDPRLHAEIAELRDRIEQTQRVRALADALPAYVSYVNADRRFVFLNRYHAEHFGRSARKLAGKPVAEVLGPTNYERMREALDHALSGQAVRGEQTLELPDGELRQVEVSCTPDRHTDGSVAGCFVMLSDVTERRQAEDLTTRVLDNLFAFVGILDVDGTLIAANEAPLKAAKLSLDQVLGQKFWDTYWFAYSPAVQDQLREACERARGGETSRYDVAVRVADDARIIIDMQVAPLRDAEGRISHLIPSAVDVTHRVEVEHQLRQSEERSRLAQRAGKVGVWEYDPNTGETFWSEVMWDIYGRAPAPGVNPNRLFLASIHPEDLDRVRGAWEALQDDGGRRELFRIIRLDGSVRWIEAIATVSPGPSGSPGRVVGVNIDVTALKQAEEVVRESEERLRLAKDAGGLGIHDYDVETQTIRWDERVRQLWGVGPDVPITTELFMSGIHPDDRERVTAIIQRAFDPQFGGRYEMEHRVISHANGQLRWVAVSGRTTFAAGRPIRSVGTVFEITARKQTETILRRHKEKLSESDRRKDEFLAMLGHELRNPLAAIRSASELLRLHTEHDPRLTRLGEVLERQSNHMVRLVDGLLEVSRIARGKILLEWTTVDLRRVLEAVLEDRREQLDRSGLELHVEVHTPPDAPALWVAGDEVRLTQIFDNLLGNAIKFTTTPGAITLMVASVGEHIEVTIRDTGAGIRRDMLETIFEPFAQDEQAIARVSGGLGIGLALVRGLVELHGGTVVARSEGPGQGSEFEVRLPKVTGPSEVATGLEDSL